MSAEETITIYADFGMSPYAWRKNSSDRSTYVGGNIADSKYGLSKVIGTSPELDAAFAEWIARFDCRGYETTLDWTRFHYDGIELAKRLKAEVGDRYEVEYHPPWEDPVRGHGDGLITWLMTPEKLFLYHPMRRPENRSATDPAISTIFIRLFDCDAGWIRMDLSIGKMQVGIWMTHWDDPIDWFRSWMEDLIKGKETSTVIINEEGNWKLLTATQKSDGLLHLRIENCSDGLYSVPPDPTSRETLLEMTLHRRQLVGTLYRGFQEFEKSPEYHSREWELFTIGDWLAEQLGMTQEKVLDALVALPAKMLNPLLLFLWHLDDHLDGEFYGPLQKMRSFEEMIDYALSHRSELEASFQRDGWEWRDVQDTDNERRRTIRDEYLIVSVRSCRGTPLRNIRSEKIDEYLTSNRDWNTP